MNRAVDTLVKVGLGALTHPPRRIERRFHATLAWAAGGVFAVMALAFGGVAAHAALSAIHGPVAGALMLGGGAAGVAVLLGGVGWLLVHRENRRSSRSADPDVITLLAVGFLAGLADTPPAKTAGPSRPPRPARPAKGPAHVDPPAASAHGARAGLDGGGGQTGHGWTSRH